MCLVEVPATYKTVTKTVLKTPATTRKVETPAEYTTVRKQVMKTPARPVKSRFRRSTGLSKPRSSFPKPRRDGFRFLPSSRRSRRRCWRAKAG